jgi:cytochrome oxidase Cu insertion factor (SCO1/SenC/PrrC family)
MANKNKAGRLKVLFSSLLLFGPASLLIFISLGKCEHRFKELDDYGILPAFNFKDEDGKVYTNKSFENQVVIFTTIQETCPYDCKMNMWALSKLVYEQMYTNSKKLKQVKIVTILTDSVGNPSFNLSGTNSVLKREVTGFDPKKWLVLAGDPKQLFATKLNGLFQQKLKGSKLSEAKKKVEGVNYNTDLVLLSDRKGHLRIFDFAQKESSMRSVRDYMNLLQKEYDKIKWKKEGKLPS